MRNWLKRHFWRVVATVIIVVGVLAIVLDWHSPTDEDKRKKLIPAVQQT